MKISRLTSERDQHPRSEEVTFESLVTLLSTATETDCDHAEAKAAAEAEGRNPNKCELRKGSAWSAATYDGQRGDAHVLGMEVLAFDLDHLTMSACEEILGRLGSLKSIVHSTHSHLPPDDVCLRLVLFPSRTLAPGEIREMRARVAHKYGLPVDPQTKNEERLYFLPRVSKHGSPFWFASQQGDVVDVDKLEPVPRSSGSFSPPASPLLGAGGAEVFATPRIESVNMATLRARVSKSKNELVKRALRGEKLADMGGRDNAVHVLCGALVFSAPDASKEALLELARESINAMDPPESGDWMELASRKMDAAFARHRAAAEKNRQVGDALSLVFRREAAQADAEAPKDEEPDGAMFTPEQVEAWASEQGTDGVGFSRRWIIQHGKGYWIFTGGKYASVLGPEDAALSVFRDLSRAPVTLYKEDNHGNQSPLGLTKIMHAYGSVARSVRASLALQQSRYDAKSQTFYEAVCPLRDLAPTFDAEVHEYLQAFGGSQAERFLDWCALLPNLDQLLCALYTMGSKNTGKSLFASSVARLWSGGSSTLTDAFKDFNDTLTRNPFCFADERLPASDTIIDDLRSFIGSKERSLNRKFLQVAALDGCARVFIAANNDTLLVNAKSSVTQQDVEALAQRIFFIDHGRAPTEMLERVRNEKGPQHLDTFRSQDRVAKHVLWLRDNRKVKLESRFGVQGVAPEFTEQLITDIENVSNMLEFLVRYICRDSPRPIKQMILGNGALLVNTEMAADKSRWEDLIVSRRTPTAKQASNALAAISDETMREIGGLQYYAVRVPMVARWMRRRGIGNVGLFEQRVNQGASV